MQVIGLAGPIGSGKGAVADFIVNKYDYERVVMGDLVREEAEKQGLQPTRDNLIRVSEQMRERNGQDYFIRKAIEKIRDEEWEKVVIDGIRLPLEIKEFRREFGDDIKFVLVNAEPKVRFERMKKRGRPGFPNTFEKFREHEKREWEKFDFKKTFSKTDYEIGNNGAWEELEEKVDKLMEEIWSE